jgi:hypothetical protein
MIPRSSFQVKKRWSENRITAETYVDMARAFSARAEASDSSEGNDTGTVKVRSGGIVPVLTACTSISIARPTFGGTKTLAASKPLFTQA